MTAPSLTVVDGGLAPARYRLTDIGNAERFVARHGHNVRFVPAWNRWLVWSGKRWESDNTFQVFRYAKETVLAMYAEAKDAAYPQAGRAELVKHAVKSEQDGKIRAMLARAQAEPGIAITTESLDAEPWLLSVENGTLDLRTSELRAHRREDLITKIVPVSYDADALCPRWEAFLRRVLADNQELIDFVQKAIGYSLTGVTSEQCLFFLYGSGKNGKSTFLEIIRALLAGYASQADFTTFLDRKGDGPRNDIARLFSARVVTSSEVGEGKRLNESLVKTLTGDEVVTARFLHAEFFEFKPAFKLWLAANHRPEIRGTDVAIWRRVRLVPFVVEIPEAERDKDLQSKLLEELPGILAWSVGGCTLWRVAGELGIPDAVKVATDTYRRDSDTLGAFLEDCCEIGNHELLAEKATELYAAYAHWCNEGGEFQITQTKFGKALEERGLPAVKRGRDKARVKWRVGVRLLVDVPQRSAAPQAFAQDDKTEQGGLSL